MAGHQVLCPLTREPAAYQTPLLQKRLGLFEKALKHYRISFGDDAFLEAIATFKPDVFINHGADIKGYRSPEFDIQKSVESSTKNLDKVLKALVAGGAKKIIHSGTVFEPIDDLPAYSPYGQSKTLVAERIRGACEEYKISLAKIFIPNPVGPFENEDRLIPFFVKQWKARAKPQLQAPNLVWDNVPAQWLANFYVNELSAPGDYNERRPSAFKIKLKDFIDRFILEAKKRSVSLNFEYEINEKAAPGELRVNDESCAELANEDAERKFFNEWIISHWPEAKKI